MSRKKRTEFRQDTLPEMKDIIREWDISPTRIKESGAGFWLKTSGGIRILQRSLSEERILFMHQVLEYLARRGYRDNVSRLIPTKYGDPYVCHGFHTYYLTDWYDGMKFKTGRREHVISAGRSLGEIHQAGRKFSPPGGEGVSRERWTDLKTKMEINLGMVQNRIPALSTPFSKAWALLAFDGEKAVEQLNGPIFNQLVEKAKSERTLCHGAFVPRHLMQGEQTMVRHWEHTAFGLQTADLISFLQKVLPEHQWDFSLAEAFLKAYQENCPLTDGDKFVLCRVLAFPTDFCRLIKGMEKTGREDKKDLKELEKILAGEKRRISFLEDFRHHFEPGCKA